MGCERTRASEERYEYVPSLAERRYAKALGPPVLVQYVVEPTLVRRKVRLIPHRTRSCWGAMVQHRVNRTSLASPERLETHQATAEQTRPSTGQASEHTKCIDSGSSQSTCNEKYLSVVLSYYCPQLLKYVSIDAAT